jgi:hypothetical protein
MENRGWIIGNIFIGVGFVAFFLYVLFGVFWENSNLLPWYVGFFLLTFIVYNFFSLKEQNIKNWGVAILTVIVYIR